jgi:transcriptional regulator with XRE-family HTH domain
MLYRIYSGEHIMILKTLKDFGAAIRDARKSAGITQATLATKLGTNQEWISNLERGRLENPGLGTILRAFSILGINLNAGSTPPPSSSEPFDTGDLAIDKPTFLKGPRR